MMQLIFSASIFDDSTEDILSKVIVFLDIADILHIADEPLPSKTSTSSSIFNLRTLVM